MAQKKSKKSLWYTAILIIAILLSYFFKAVDNSDKHHDNGMNKHVFHSVSRGKNDTTRLIVMFYNLENFFDTIDDQHNHYDNEYTPNSKKHWTSKRYITKIKHLGQVFVNVDTAELPDLIGVCEIENRHVLEDLVNKTVLKGYDIVHYESKDIRGIDLGLLYDPSEFKVLETRKIDIYYKPGHPARTREIVYIKGQTRNGQILHIFLNHWKSRLSRHKGNTSEYKRILAAKSLKKAVYSILKKDPTANIIIMGDFNDEPMNKSLAQVLGAKDKTQYSRELYNAMWPLDEQGKGTYFHDHKWMMFDNIILSGAFLSDNSRLVPEGNGHILMRDFMLKQNRNHEHYPWRTFSGSHYLGGYSDHLPVYIIIDVRY